MVHSNSDQAKQAPAGEAILRVEGLSKRYGRTVALDGVSLEVRPSELFALLGPNGAGKTTLIHILCTLLRPDSGTMMLAGFDVVRSPLAASRRGVSGAERR
jgi:ABC-2 type transport system ATP-binding protein